MKAELTLTITLYRKNREEKKLIEEYKKSDEWKCVGFGSGVNGSYEIFEKKVSEVGNEIDN